MSRRRSVYLTPRAVLGHVIVLAAALTCLRLGWWQWDVYEYAARGTLQNFGYALLWPFFALCFIGMWLRYLQLAHEYDDSAGYDDHAGYDAAPGPHSSRDGAVGPDGGPAAAAGARSVPGPPGAGEGEPRPGRHTRSADPDMAGATVGVGYIDSGDDPELAAYNRALARLADEDATRDR